MGRATLNSTLLTLNTTAKTAREGWNGLYAALARFLPNTAKRILLRRNQCRIDALDGVAKTGCAGSVYQEFPQHLPQLWLVVQSSVRQKQKCADKRPDGISQLHHSLCDLRSGRLSLDDSI